MPARAKKKASRSRKPRAQRRGPGRRSAKRKAAGASKTRAARRRSAAPAKRGRKATRKDFARACGLEPKALTSLFGRILSLGLFRRVENTFYFDDSLFRFWAVRASDRGKGAGERFTGEEAGARAAEYMNDYLAWDYGGGSEADFLYDLENISWVGIYIRRNTAVEQIYGIDNFQLWIPEPSEWMMMAALAAVWVVYRRRKGS